MRAATARGSGPLPGWEHGARARHVPAAAGPPVLATWGTTRTRTTVPQASRWCSRSPRPAGVAPGAPGVPGKRPGRVGRSSKFRSVQTEQPRLAAVNTPRLSAVERQEMAARAHLRALGLEAFADDFFAQGVRREVLCSPSPAAGPRHAAAENAMGFRAAVPSAHAANCRARVCQLSQA